MPDDLQSVLDPAPVDQSVKADAWDAYHAATSPEDFQARFDKLALPQNTKADLWDLRFSGGLQRPATPAAPRVPEFGLAPVPVPRELQGPPAPETGGIPVPLDPMTGGPIEHVQPAAPGITGTLGRIAVSPQMGVEDVIAGVPQIGRGLRARRYTGGLPIALETGKPQPLPEGDISEVAKGAHKVISGGMQAVAPVVLPASFAAAPIATGLGLATSIGAQQVASRGLKALGAQPEYADLAGDIAALVPWFGLGAEYLDHIIDTRARIAEESADLWQQRGDVRDRVANSDAIGNGLFSRPMPITINGRPAWLEYNGTSQSGVTAGRLGFRVVDAQSGQTLYGGLGSDVNAWLSKMGAHPDLPEHAPGAILPEQLEQSEAQQQPPRRQGALMREFGQQVQPGAQAPPERIGLDELALLDRDPNEVKNPRKREQLIDRQIAIARKLQLLQNAGAAHAEPFAGLEEEVAASPTKGAGAPPTAQREALLREPDGTFTVRDTIDGTNLFNGSVEDARAFLAERTGAQFQQWPSAEEAGVTVGGEEEAKPTGEVTPGYTPGPPNLPTSATKTAPESPDTLATQMQQLAEGKRWVVMFPEGTEPPDDYAPGLAITSDDAHNIYVYRPDPNNFAASKKAMSGRIRQAAKQNRLPEILGSAKFGLQAPDKSELEKQPPENIRTVVSRDTNGNEVQSTATTLEALPATIAAHQDITPPGGAVTVEPPGGVLGQRAVSSIPSSAPSGPPAELPAEPAELAAPAPIEQAPAPEPIPGPHPKGALEQPEYTLEDAEAIRARYRRDVEEAARLYAQQHPEATANDLKRRFQIGHGAATRILAARPAPPETLEAPQALERAPEAQPEPQTKHEFASTQANLAGPIADAVRSFASSIPEAQLAEDGRETQPHVTVKYGLHADDPAEVVALLRDEAPISARLGKTSLFQSDKADVLKVDVNSPDLHRLNEKIASLPHTDTHPKYIPHVTIAYLKPGEGKAYAGKAVPGITGQTVTLNEISFSGKNGEQVAIPLTGVAPEEKLTAPVPVERPKPPKPVTPQIPNEAGVKYVLPSFVTGRHAKATAPEELAAPEPIEKPAILEPEPSAVPDAIQPENRPPLETQLPERGESAGTGEPAPKVSGRRSRPGGKRAKPGAGEGTGVPPSVRTSDPGVGSPADASRNFPNFPPRAGSVTSTRFAHDYRIPDGRVVSGSPETRAENNIAAIEVLRELQRDNRPATVDEQKTLAGYVGWGAVPQIFAGNTPEWKTRQDRLRSLISEEEFENARRSTTNAHYTSDAVVDAMWQAVEHLGAKPGMSWLEPAVGVGNFFGRQPEALLDGARRVGIDKDSLTGQIAKYLYPDSGIDVKPFEEAELPENYFDGAISNVPFGDFGVHDPAFKNKPYLTSSIHNYFFAKSLDYVRPGGIVAFVTSRYTMDGYQRGHVAVREYLDSKADFLGAVRLPTNAFAQSSGTHVITDIIFLRKRLPDAEPAGQDWRTVETKNLRTPQGHSQPIGVNQYFHAHPENVLGTEKLERGQFTSADYNVEGSLTPEALRAALEKALPADAFQEFTPAKRSRKVALGELSSTEEAKKIGGLFFDEKGNLYRKLSKGVAEPVEVNRGVQERIRGQLGIRNVLGQLIRDEQADLSESALTEQRKALNAAYDAYVRKHGPLSSRANVAAMLGDPDAPLLTALEKKYDEKGKTAEKGAIFTKRIFQPVRKVTSAGDAKEALYISLNETGAIDWKHMEQLTAKTPAELQSDLKGLVFEDPKNGSWQTAEEYLSGAVRSKLKEAKKYAKVDPRFDENVKALEAVQPEDIPPSQISAMPGVTWVPAETYGQFVQHVLNADTPPKVNYVAGEWHFDRPYTRAASKWSTAEVDAYTILKDTMNLRRTKVYKNGPDNKPVLDKEATLAAREKQKQLADYFEKWAFADAQRADMLMRLYNDQVNDLRLRTYDGSHLTLPEMSRAILRSGDLEPYQKAAVWRQIAQRNVLLAHAVGSGKTFEMIAGGMELQRLGLIKRPMYVVPNATLTGWQEQFAMLYPQKRVLVFSEKDLEQQNRRRIFAQIATGEWDAVIVPHSSFKFIPVGDELFDAHYRKLADELEASIRDAQDAGADTRLIKKLEKAKEKLLTAMKERRNETKQDKTVTWEQLGIDQLYVDEAHEYKKLGFGTKQQNVAGIDPNGNQMTFDLRMKMGWTQQHGRGVTFASGTPVTNTMGELYNVMQYLIQPELDARGLGRFDEWAANFGRTKDVFEPKPEGGGYQVKARFAEFVNVAELSQLFRSFADVLTSDMLDIPRPKIAGGERQSRMNELNEAQRDYMSVLQDRAAAIRRNARAALPDNMAALYTDAQKMALDARMVNPDAPDSPDSRLNQAADEIHHLWQESADTKGTQLVFMDFGKPKSAGGQTAFSAYDDLIKKLEERGIPSNEITHIYTAKTKAQRAKLFQQVRDGEIRVLLGSTGKMGTGVNVQERVYAMHHLTLPHRPSDLEQREGRGIRQGNIHPEVHILYYGTKGSLDELKFANVSRKAKAFAQFMQGKSTLRKMEDVDDIAPSLDQFQAEASGDPRVKRKLEVDNEILRLSALNSAWRDEQWKNRRELNEIPGRVERSEKAIANYQRDIERRDKTGRVWQIGKQKLEGEGLQKAAAAALEKRLTDDKIEKIGTAYGLELVGNRHGVSIGDGDAHVHVPYTFDDKGKATGINGVGLFTRIENQVKHFEGEITHNRDIIERANKNAKILEAALDETWPNQREYDRLLTEQQELFNALGGGKSDAGALGGDEDIEDQRVAASEAPAEEEEDGERGKEEPGERRDVYLGAGLGGLQPHLENLGREEIAPLVRQAFEGTQETVAGLVHLLAPRAGVPVEVLDQIYRMRGAREAAQFVLTRKLDNWSKRVDTLSQKEMTEFIDRVKTGQKQPDAELQALADFLREMDDALYQEITKYKPSLEYLEDHFRVLWKIIPNGKGKAGRTFWGGRRPLEGSRGMLRKHTLTTMSEGIAAGGVPYSYNPIKMFKAHYADSMKFITAQRLWEDFRKTGTRVFVRLGGSAPVGYVKLTDPRLTNVYFPVKEGAVHAGTWYVEQGAARLLNNFLSGDFIREAALGRFLLGVKNVTTAIELSFSPFHAVFETIEAMGSEVGIAFREMLNIGLRQRDKAAFGRGLKSLATFAAAPVEAARLGAKAKKAYGNFAEFSQSPEGKKWLQDHPSAIEGVQAFFDGGGKMGMHEDYRISAYNSFREYLASAKKGALDKYVMAALKFLPAVNELVMRPLFEWYIPNLKLGFFLKEYALGKSEYSDRLASGEMTLPQLARDTVDSVENRFGEMNFDNLFWKRAFKTFMQLIFRSVTWKLGNLRAQAGAAVGQLGEFRRAIASGEPPVLDPKMAWFLGMTLVTAIIGGTIHTVAGLMSGKKLKDAVPHQLKDFVFPLVGVVRLSVPSYWRDMIHLAHSPKGYVTSSLSGEIGRLAQVWQNKDFYSRQVYGPDDPLPERAWDIFRHLFPEQFGYSSYKQVTREGGSNVAMGAGFFGFTKAPRYIEETDAEQLAGEYASGHQEVGARTREQSERSDAKRAVRNIYRRGADPAAQVREFEEKGLLSPRDIPQLRKEARQNPLQREIQGLTLIEQLNVYDKATPEEQKAIRHQVETRARNARMKGWQWTPRARELAQKHFGIRPYIHLQPREDLAAPSAIY